MIGLLLNLFGAFKVYKSVKPYNSQLYAQSGKDRKALPSATLDIAIAKVVYSIFFGLHCIYTQRQLRIS